MSQEGHTIFDSLLRSIRNGCLYVTSSPPPGVSWQCVVLACTREATTVNTRQYLSRTYSEEGGKIALGWDIWGSLSEEWRFKLSPEGFCLALDQKGIPVKKLIWAKILGGQLVVSLLSERATWPEWRVHIWGGRQGQVWKMHTLEIILMKDVESWVYRPRKGQGLLKKEDEFCYKHSLGL